VFTNVSPSAAPVTQPAEEPEITDPGDDTPLILKVAVFASFTAMQAIVVTSFVVVGCFFVFGGRMPMAHSALIGIGISAALTALGLIVDALESWQAKKMG
jgi:hypothetical protein